jgi:sedoheptulose-bisphosphatase
MQCMRAACPHSAAIPSLLLSSFSSIFSVFPGRELVGQRVSGQAAVAIAQYGPRTSMMFGLASDIVFEATLDADRGWIITRRDVRIAPTTKIFAPANLRCATENAAYKQLVHYYIDQKYTLRYSGGLVPDFYHVLSKSNGIFLSPVSPSHKAKLRLVYECACLAMLSVWAGGAAVNERGEAMADQTLTGFDVRSGLIIGSTSEVERYKKFVNK